MVCTPTWKRIGIALFTAHMENTLRARNILAVENGNPEELLAEGIKAMDRGDLKLKVEGDSISEAVPPNSALTLVSEVEKPIA